MRSSAATTASAAGIRNGTAATGSRRRPYFGQIPPCMPIGSTPAVAAGRMTAAAPSGFCRCERFHHARRQCQRPDGSDQTFLITPDEGYAISDVRIDGRSIGAVMRYTFENVRSAHTIEASFTAASTFADVPAGSYYERAVVWAAANRHYQRRRQRPVWRGRALHESAGRDLPVACRGQPPRRR